MTTIILSEFEAKGIREGRVGLLVKPITGKSLDMLLNGTWDLPVPMVEDIYGESHPITDFAPYHPGQVVGAREAWAECFEINNRLNRVLLDEPEANWEFVSIETIYDFGRIAIVDYYRLWMMCDNKWSSRAEYDKFAKEHKHD